VLLQAQLSLAAALVMQGALAISTESSEQPAMCKVPAHVVMALSVPPIVEALLRLERHQEARRHKASAKTTQSRATAVASKSSATRMTANLTQQSAPPGHEPRD